MLAPSLSGTLAGIVVAGPGVGVSGLCTNTRNPRHARGDYAVAIRPGFAGLAWRHGAYSAAADGMLHLVVSEHRRAAGAVRECAAAAESTGAWDAATALDRRQRQ